ncbi:hypothetical protein [Caballeronia sp.]|uniref:hypothetical protein n=1 Tax=Caballeronia sp. TaxID=1931223 RepID=UPI003C66C0A1
MKQIPERVEGGAPGADTFVNAPIWDTLDKLVAGAYRPRRTRRGAASANVPDTWSWTTGAFSQKKADGMFLNLNKRAGQGR